MAKSKKKQKQIGHSQQLEIARRELEKGNSKQALKYAKLCYREDPNESVRSLLQRALLSRGRELHMRAMFEPARAVVVELDELGNVAAEYMADANRLRILLGLRTESDNPELLEDCGLRGELADQAVLVGTATTRRAAKSDVAENVRAALFAAEAGQFEQATDLVAGIGRESPYCDWKLLVRGLCAYYEGDEGRRTANWSRLAPDRPARKIADSLTLLAEPKRFAEVSQDIQSRVKQLTRSLETPLIGSLKALKRKLHDPDCDVSGLRTELRRFMNTYATSEPSVAQRVATIFVQRAIRQDDDDDELLAMRRFLPRSPIDPHLNRAAALLAENQRDLSEMERYWTAYINDLKSCPGFDESQKVMAAALVYYRLATQHVEAIEDIEHDGLFGFNNFDDKLTEALERSAVTYFRKSLEANPNATDVHIAFGQFLQEKKRSTEAAAVFHELGLRFSEDADSLVAAARYFVLNDAPVVGKEFALKARVLRPRDSETLSLAWAACVGSARAAVLQRNFRLAEAELVEAESLIESGNFAAYIVYSMRTASALKEGNLEAAGRYLQQTIEQFEKPTAALLIVDSQARRCNVDAIHMKDIRDRLDKALKGRKNAETAGVLAKYFYALGVHNVDYAGIDTHVKQVDAYLNKCTRIKWHEDQLVDACEFAHLTTERLSLLKKLARRGISLFPRHPYFHFFSGRAEMARGPSHCSFRAARTAFERAIELGKQGDIPLKEPYCHLASDALRLLKKHEFALFGSWFVGRIDDDDDDDDSFDDDIIPHMTQEAIDRAVATMPPELKQQIERSGLSPLDAVKALIGIIGGGSK